MPIDVLKKYLHIFLHQILDKQDGRQLPKQVYTEYVFQSGQSEWLLL